MACRNELLEPGYLYSGLPTLTDADKKTDIHNNFVACLDGRLVNSKLYYSLDLAPWAGEDKIAEYLTTKQNRLFDEDDPRCHVFIFCWGDVSVVVTMRFRDGEGPIDIQRIAEADEHTHPLKRLFHHETLELSENTRLDVTPCKPFPDD
ncbi:MAG: hypothetical protein AAGB97_02670 [Dehalococcoidia bacterium]|nr:hypothetical protein [Chloroflexota bacterium]MBT9160160.1 hypothetical protein [Chloroflexota bacterium]MBT9162167.1 hypothetical protein [Chloroflexota bacterium]